MSGGETGAALACLGAGGVAGLRWLRVAQREHYLAGSVLRFARRWWSATPGNALLALVAAAGAVVSAWWTWSAFVTASVVVAGPFGLSPRGRTAPLVWTRRLRSLATVWVVLQIGMVVVGWSVGAAALAAAAAAVGTPLLVDLVCWITAPVERLASSRYVRSAKARLEAIRPAVVAITGSYGKTSTKVYVTHLLSGTFSVVASPASFNNRAGLARTVNEHLVPATDVLVVEMGTYGPGEIADLCRWIPPDTAVITAIGPVHLERFGSEDKILEAKTEIVELAQTVVLNVDDPRLKDLAHRLSEAGRKVVRCSVADADADVDIPADAVLPPYVAPTNAACAIGVARHFGIDERSLSERMASLPEVASRSSVYVSAAGFTVIDDTYNSNPVGCRAALSSLTRMGNDGARRVVVTPGMVELGRRQAEENFAFAAEAARLSTDLVIVGRTNRQALMRGAQSATDSRGARIIWVAHREQAVAWVRDHLGSDDVVLYENDLPDHYP